jgi:hypothetical protein
MGARFFAPLHTGPGAHPASCTMATRSFPRVKNDRGVTLTPHPLLVPWWRKGRAKPLLPLDAVWPVQSFSVCIRVHFNFFTHVLLNVQRSRLRFSYRSSENICFTCVPHSVSISFSLISRAKYYLAGKTNQGALNFEVVFTLIILFLS